MMLLVLGQELCYCLQAPDVTTARGKTPEATLTSPNLDLTEVTKHTGPKKILYLQVPKSHIKPFESWFRTEYIFFVCLSKPSPLSKLQKYG
jgi:hypothetical protein